MKKEYSQPLEFNRGGNFKLEDQPVRKPINQNSANDGWQRGAFAEKPKEKEKEKEKEDNWRGTKVEKPKEKEDNWRGSKVEKPKEKEESWRGSKVEKPKEKNDGQWERGANAGKKNKKK